MKTSPAVFRNGDIVEVQITLTSIAIKQDRFKTLMQLRSIALIDDSHTIVSRWFNFILLSKQNHLNGCAESYRSKAEGTAAKRRLPHKDCHFKTQNWIRWRSERCEPKPEKIEYCGRTLKLPRCMINYNCKKTCTINRIRILHNSFQLLHVICSTPLLLGNPKAG